MESLRPLHKAGFTDVLDYGIFLFKKHFRKICIINLLFYLPFSILLTLINPVFSSQYQSFLNPGESMLIEPGEMFSSIITLYATILGSFLLYGIYSITFKNVFEGSMIKIIYADIVLNREITIWQAVRECFRQFGTCMLGRLLYILILCLMAVVLYFIILVGVFAGTFTFFGTTAVSLFTPWWSVVLMVIGALVLLAALFFVFVAAGYFVGKYWMFLPAICIEQKKVGLSIGRCGNLGKNSFYLIGLSYIAGAVLVAFLPGILNIIFIVINSASGSLDMSIMRIGAVITQLFSAFLQPLITCIMTALYITLRVRREGLDMEAIIWEIKDQEMKKSQRWVTGDMHVTE